MAIHDVGDHSKMLLSGMVFNIKLTLAYRKIKSIFGLKTLLLSPKQAQKLNDLTLSYPMDIKGIEKLMCERGMVDQYKPLIPSCKKIMPHYQILESMNRKQTLSFFQIILPVLFLGVLILYGMVIRPKFLGQTGFPLEIVFMLAAVKGLPLAID